MQRSQTVRAGGALRSDNAGMSSESRVRIPSTECLGFPGEGSSAEGWWGPKPRLKSVGDGQQVDIPVPPNFRLSNGGTQEDRVSTASDVRVQAGRLEWRQILHSKVEL